MRQLVSAALSVCGLIAAASSLSALGPLNDSQRLYARCGAIALAGVAAWLMTRQPAGQASRWPRITLKLLTVMPLIAVLAMLLHDATPSLDALFRRGELRTWNVYHYYINAKYFDELGYFSLYEQTILADHRSAKPRLRDVKLIRNLHTYEKVGAARFRDAPLATTFTDRRFKRFQRDTNILIRQASRRVLADMMVDRGYNATPFWNSLGSALANNISIKATSGRVMLASLDFAIYAALLIAVALTFGGFAALASFAAFWMLPINAGRLVGGFLQYDWLLAVALGVVFLRRGNQVAAAVAMAFATMSRVFPLVLALAPLVPALADAWRNRRFARGDLNYLVAFASACIVFFLVGCLNAHGANAWVDWFEKIMIHNQHHVFGERRVGLKALFTTDLGVLSGVRLDGSREAWLSAQLPFVRVIQAVFLAGFVALAARASRPNSILLALAVVFVVFVLSRYYWSVAVLLLLWRNENEPESQDFVSLVALLIVTALVPGWILMSGGTTSSHADYVVLNALLLLAFSLFYACVLSIPLLSRLAPMRADALRRGGTRR